MKNERWPWQPIGELFEIGAGKTMSVSARTGANPVPFLRTSNVLWDDIDLSTVDRMSMTAEELTAKSLLPGDILVCEGGDVGRAAVWPGGEESVSFQNHLHRLRPLDQQIVPRFFVFFLQSAFTQLGMFEGAANDTTIPNLSRNRLSALEVPVPPVEEQSNVARVLGQIRHSLKLESAIVNNSRQLKQAAMRNLFTRGLRAEAQKELEFGDAPQSWRHAPLSDVAEVQTGAAKGRKFVDTDLVEAPYLRVANVQDGHLDLSEMKKLRIRRAEIERYRLCDGDVVLTEGGDFDKLGRGSIWRSELPLCIHQNHVFAVRTDRTVLQPEFFAYLAQSPYGRAYFLQVAHKTTNLACINSNKLKAFPVILPTLEEQRDIVDILTAIDQKIDLHKKRRAILEDLFESLLYKLMTGGIRVSDLDLSALEQGTTAEVSA